MSEFTQKEEDKTLIINYATSIIDLLDDHQVMQKKKKQQQLTSKFRLFHRVCKHKVVPTFYLAPNDGNSSWVCKVRVEVWMEEHSKRLLLVKQSHFPVGLCLLSRTSEVFKDLSQVLFKVNRLEGLLQNQAELQSSLFIHRVLKPRRGRGESSSCEASS